MFHLTEPILQAAIVRGAVIHQCIKGCDFLAIGSVGNVTLEYVRRTDVRLRDTGTSQVDDIICSMI